MKVIVSCDQSHLMLQGLSSYPNIILRYGTTLCPKRVLYLAILSSRFLIAANDHHCRGEFILSKQSDNDIGIQ